MLFLMHQCTRAHVFCVNVCIYVCVSGLGNELRDMLREKGANGDSILNGDECVL